MSRVPSYERGKRVGKRNSLFTLYDFNMMYSDSQVKSVLYNSHPQGQSVYEHKTYLGYLMLVENINAPATRSSKDHMHLLEIILWAHGIFFNSLASQSPCWNHQCQPVSRHSQMLRK